MISQFKNNLFLQVKPQGLSVSLEFVQRSLITTQKQTKQSSQVAIDLTVNQSVKYPTFSSVICLHTFNSLHTGSANCP